MVLLVTSVALQAKSLGFMEQLPVGKKLVYRHWNTKKNKVTGYSVFEYKQVKIDGVDYILEHNLNTKPSGKAFTEKNLLLHGTTGMPQRYEESDFRNDFSILNQYRQGLILTKLTKEGETREFSQPWTDDFTPIEVFALYIRSIMPELMQKDKASFTLYIPMLAFDLEAQGLPHSWSSLQMVAEVKKSKQVESPLGELEALELVIYPDSFLIRSLLPKAKTHFNFVISTQKPYYILQIMENQTRHYLESIEEIPSNPQKQAGKND